MDANHLACATNPEWIAVSFSKIPSMTFPLPANSASGPAGVEIAEGRLVERGSFHLMLLMSSASSSQR